jgi:hypothetical protein
MGDSCYDSIVVENHIRVDWLLHFTLKVSTGTFTGVVALVA